MQSVIAVMSLMGSVMLLFFYLLRPFAQRLFSAQWEYGLLKVCLCFFLTPFPLLKNYILQLYKVIDNTFTISSDPQLVYMDRVITFISGSQIALPTVFSIVIIAAAFWLIGFGVILAYHLQGYLKMRNYVTQSSKKHTDLRLLAQVEQLKKDYKINRNISVLKSEIVKTPFTIGIFSTLIILPDEDISEEKMKYILTHELAHVKQFDFFIRMLGVLTMALHWFNPFSYLLFWELTKCSEYACDEKVVLKLNENQRVIYGNMILDMCSHHIFKRNFGKTLINSFGTDNKKRMKSRLLKMKYAKKSKLGKCMIAGVVTSCISIMSFMTVFAYKDLIVIEGFKDSGMDGTTVRERSPNQWTEVKPNLPHTKPSTYYYNQNGIFCIEAVQNSNDDKALCDHSYYDSTVVVHLPKSNGGCVESDYKARICHYCDKITRGSLISSTTYTSCPH